MADNRNNNLGDSIYFEEKMVEAYDGGINAENRHRTRMHQKKVDNRRKFKVYIFVLCIAAFFDLVAFFAMGYIGNVDFGFFYGVMFLMGALVIAFSGPLTAFCIYKTIYYFRRCNHEFDRKDFKWKSYDEIQTESMERSSEIKKKRDEVNVQLAVNRQIRDELVERQSLALEQEETPSISMDELYDLKKNAVVISEQEEAILGLCAAYSIVPVRPEMWEEYADFIKREIPNAQTGKARANYSKNQNGFFAVMQDGEIGGACFGWGAATDEPDSITVRGLAVSDGLKGQGIGTALLREFEKNAVSDNYKKVYASPGSGYAEHFLIKNGYLPVCYKWPDGFGDYNSYQLTTMNDYKNVTRKEGGYVVFKKKMC